MTEFGLAWRNKIEELGLVEEVKDSFYMMEVLDSYFTEENNELRD